MTSSFTVFCDDMASELIGSGRATTSISCSTFSAAARVNSMLLLVFFFKQKTAYEIGLGIPAEPLFRSTAYDVYPLDGRHDGGYYTVKDCVTIDVLPRTPGNNVYVGFMVWSNFTATKCRGLVSLNQVIKEIICLQPLK